MIDGLVEFEEIAEGETTDGAEGQTEEEEVAEV